MSVDAIIVGDIHLRDDQPECWVDDYFEAQAEAVTFMRDLATKYVCPIIAPGDIFHKWNSSHQLVSWAINNLPRNIICIAGQHDLPQHRLQKLSKSALTVLKSAGVVKMPSDRRSPVLSDPDAIWGYSWGESLSSGRKNGSGEAFRRKIAMAHVMTFAKKDPYHGAGGDSAKKLLEKMAGFDLIVTGDNHEPFTVRDGKRLLVNAGSMMRMRADQMDHKPRFYLWDGEENDVEAVYLPYKKTAISRDHIDRKDDRDERIDAFVSRLKDDIEIGFSFEDNLKKFMMKENTESSVEKMVLESLEA